MRTKCCVFIVSNWYRTGIELVSNWYRTGIELMYRAGLEMGGGCRTRGRVFHKPSGPEIGTVFRGELLYTSQTLRRDCVTFGLLQTTCPGIRSFFGGFDKKHTRNIALGKKGFRSPQTTQAIRNSINQLTGGHQNLAPM